MWDGAIETAPKAAKKRELDSDDEADKPSILPNQGITINKRQSNDSRGNVDIRCEAKKPAQSSAMQVIGGIPEILSRVESSHLTTQSSIDLDYQERSLYDRVSREEASIFRSAKSYRQSVEKRRRLGD